MNKSVFTVLTSSVVALTVLGATSLKSQALTVNFSFDRTFDGTVTPPIVGTGTFSFDGDPGNGTFALTSLANYDFSFNVNGNSFTNTDIRTPVANVLVRILDNGTDRLVNFGGSGGGPFGGSLDFINASNRILTFQPFFGTLYQSSGAAGTYQGIIPQAPTPVPAPASLLGVLFASLVGAVAKSKKQAQPSLEKVN